MKILVLHIAIAVRENHYFDLGPKYLHFLYNYKKYNIPKNCIMNTNIQIKKEIVFIEYLYFVSNIYNV